MKNKGRVIGCSVGIAIGFMAVPNYVSAGGTGPYCYILVGGTYCVDEPNAEFAQAEKEYLEWMVIHKAEVDADIAAMQESQSQSPEIMSSHPGSIIGRDYFGEYRDTYKRDQNYYSRTACSRRAGSSNYRHWFSANSRDCKLDQYPCDSD